MRRRTFDAALMNLVHSSLVGSTVTTRTGQHSSTAKVNFQQPNESTSTALDTMSHGFTMDFSIILLLFDHLSSLLLHAPAFVVANWILSFWVMLFVRAVCMLDAGSNSILVIQLKLLSLFCLVFSAVVAGMLHHGYGIALSAAGFLVFVMPAWAAFTVDSLVRGLWCRGILAIFCVLLLLTAYCYLILVFSRKYYLDTDDPACPLCGREAKTPRVLPWWTERETNDPTSDDFTPELMWRDSHQAYKCPGLFKCPGELAIHLLEDHLERKSYCPGCFKPPRQYGY